MNIGVFCVDISNLKQNEKEVTKLNVLYKHLDGLECSKKLFDIISTATCLHQDTLHENTNQNNEKPSFQSFSLKDNDKVNIVSEVTPNSQLCLCVISEKYNYEQLQIFLTHIIDLFQFLFGSHQLAFTKHNQEASLFLSKCYDNLSILLQRYPYETSIEVTYLIETIINNFRQKKSSKNSREFYLISDILLFNHHHVLYGRRRLTTSHFLYHLLSESQFSADSSASGQIFHSRKCFCPNSTDNSYSIYVTSGLLGLMLIFETQKCHMPTAPANLIRDSQKLLTKLQKKLYDKLNPIKLLNHHTINQLIGKRSGTTNSEKGVLNWFRNRSNSLVTSSSSTTSKVVDLDNLVISIFKDRNIPIYGCSYRNELMNININYHPKLDTNVKPETQLILDNQMHLKQLLDSSMNTCSWMLYNDYLHCKDEFKYHQISLLINQEIEMKICGFCDLVNCDWLIVIVEEKFDWSAMEFRDLIGEMREFVKDNFRDQF